MKVRVKFREIVATTDKAAKFETKGGQEFWLPLSGFELTGDPNVIVTSDKLMEGKGVDFKPLYHVPEPLDPVYSQEADDALRY